MQWSFLHKTKTVETAHEPPAKGITGATIRVRSTEGGRQFGTQEQRAEAELHKAWMEMYDTTVAGSIIDSEVDDIFAQGWAIQGEDEDEVAKVREYLDAVGFVTEVKKLCTESKIYGFGLAEVGKLGARHVLVAHSSFNIYTVMDDDGWLDGFVQMGSNDRVLADWNKNEVLTLALRPNAANPGTGRSELAQAANAIEFYEDVAKANHEMILRMGYPSYEVKFEDSDGMMPSQMIEGEFADIGPGSGIVSALGSRLNVLNSQGITQAAAYAETALQAVAVAMQVPRSMAGLADNSEATAKVTTAKYYNRIAAEQAIIAQTMQTAYLDRYVLPDLGIKPGTMQLFFNSPDPDAQLKRAQLLQILTSLDPTDPEYLLSVEEQAEIWGKHPRRGEYDESRMRDEIIDRMMAHIGSIEGGPIPPGASAQVPQDKEVPRE